MSLLLALVDPTGPSGQLPTTIQTGPRVSVAATVEQPVLRSFTIAATGDLLIHSPIYRRAALDAGGRTAAFDFGPMFTEVAPILSAADLAICHLEVPLAGKIRRLSSYPVFNAPAELAAALSTAGWDACSTASNHALDQGAAGIDETLRVLDEAGIAHSGTARSAGERASATVRAVGGVRVSHLSYTYGLNGFRRPSTRPWIVNLIDPETILDDAHLARAQDGAEFVVVSLHWGDEYRTSPSSRQRQIAEQLMGSGAVDLILGHHAHVVQPVEKIGNGVVAFGLGNFLSNQSAFCCRAATNDGVILHLTVRERPEGGFFVDTIGATPTFVERPAYVVRRAGDGSLARTMSSLGPQVSLWPSLPGEGSRPLGTPAR